MGIGIELGLVMGLVWLWVGLGSSCLWDSAVDALTRVQDRTCFQLFKQPAVLLKF